VRFLESLPDRREITRPAAIERHAGKGSQDVRDTPQFCANLRSKLGPLDEICDGVEPCADGHRLDKRACEPRGKEARPRARGAAVNGGEKAAASFTRQGPGKLEIGARRGVDAHDAHFARTLRDGQRRARTTLGALDIGDGGTRRRELAA
jgi:hypothetical protein